MVYDYIAILISKDMKFYRFLSNKMRVFEYIFVYVHITKSRRANPIFAYYVSDKLEFQSKLISS